MKIKLLSLFLFIITYINAQTVCENGFAGMYPCNDYDLMSHMPLSVFGATGNGNDSWGWVDPQTNKEYAIMGVNNGTCFIDITDPVNPIYLGKIPTSAGSNLWRDIKTYQNYAFIVADNVGNHGMQVFDLTRLRNVQNPPETFTLDAHFTDFGEAHNIVINEDTGYAYIVGTDKATSPYFGDTIFVNIQDPTNPINEGVFSIGDYSHDAQVISYNGPDTEHQGKEIFIGSNEFQIVIADVTDKASPEILTTIEYTNVAYTHQGWFTEDQRYFLIGDELDEQNFGNNTLTLLFDLNDLDNPVQLDSYVGTTPAIDHNGYVLGDTFFLANYTAGARMLDISDLGNILPTEIGFFDTIPSDDNARFDGVWTVYPYFPSGNIIISDFSGGLFVIRKTGSSLSVPNYEEQADFVLSPNPTDNYFEIKALENQINRIEVYTLLGQQIYEEDTIGDRFSVSVSGWSPGVYLVRLNETSTFKKLIIK